MSIVADADTLLLNYTELWAQGDVSHDSDCGSEDGEEVLDSDSRAIVPSQAATVTRPQPQPAAVTSAQPPWRTAALRACGGRELPLSEAAELAEQQTQRHKNVVCFTSPQRCQLEHPFQKQYDLGRLARAPELLQLRGSIINSVRECKAGGGTAMECFTMLHEELIAIGTRSDSEECGLQLTDTIPIRLCEQIRFVDGRRPRLW